MKIINYLSYLCRYINRQRVEQPDIVIGIHPGLHAEGVYEFWEPTLDLLLDKNVKTAFTVLSEEEYVQVSRVVGKVTMLYTDITYTFLLH